MDNEIIPRGFPLVRKEDTLKMHSGQTIDNAQRVTEEQPEYRHSISPSASPTSSTLRGSNSQSPLRVPQGVIVRTPSGRDYQGRKTPPRFFAITNEQLQQMHSTSSKDSIGPKHLKFKGANQTVDARQECLCTNSVRKSETDTLLKPKDLKDRTETIEGMITLKSLIEAEIRRSDMTTKPKAQEEDTHTCTCTSDVDQFSSSFASPRIKDTHQVDSCMQKHKEMTTLTTCLFDERSGATLQTNDDKAVPKTTPALDNYSSTSMLSTTEPFSRGIISNPSKAMDPSSSECKSDGSSLDPSSECHIATSDHKIPKGSLLDMLLSSTEPFDHQRIDRPSLNKDYSDGKKRTNAGIYGQKSVLLKKSSKPPNESSSKEIVAPKWTSVGSKEKKDSHAKKEILDEDRMFPHIAGSSHIITQTSITVPEIHSENSSTLQNWNIGGAAFLLYKAESKLTSDVSQPLSWNNIEVEPDATSINSKAPASSVSSLQTMGTSILTQSKNTDMKHGFSASTGKGLDSAVNPEVRSTDHEVNVSKNFSRDVKRQDDNTTALDHCQKPSKTSDDRNDDNTPGQEEKAKCHPKTTLIINPAMTNSATVGSSSSGSPGQLFGLVRSSNNATGPVVLIALGSSTRSSNGSTNLPGSGANAVKPKTSTPVMINNMALTGNINTDAFNVWKSYVRTAYHEKYGTNCEYYMHNQWVSMSVAEKSPFVHQVHNRLHPPVLVQTSSSKSIKTSQEVIVIKAPTAKNSKPEIQRQINVIPRLQTTGPDRIIADNPVSATEQDVLKELYRSTNMADISCDFPMASNNSTLRKMMKSSSDFLTDPASSFDPLFAQCLLSGRRYDIDNWMAMKSKWRETPEWIVDFLADYDERKKARRAAIDAGVMRRVAMVQRMVGMQNDDDDAGTSSVQTPQKHSGKKYTQFCDSKENEPTCKEKSHQSMSTGESSPKVGASHGKKGDKSLTPTTRTLTVAHTCSISHDHLTTRCEKPSRHNESQHSSFHSKPENQPPVVAPRTPKASNPAVPLNAPLPTGEDKGLSDALPALNAESKSMVSQEHNCNSQDENFIGDLDLINDEELWNIQCSLFPPWQRVPSFIDADAAEDFFKDLDMDRVGVFVSPPPTSVTFNRQMENVAEDTTVIAQVYGTEQDKHCGEALPSTSSSIKEINATEKNVSIIPSPIPQMGKSEMKANDSPHVKRCLFSDNRFKNECQPEDHEPTGPVTPSLTKTAYMHKELNCGKGLDERTESTNNGDNDNGIQSTDPISREEEEDAAVSKLLEILDETHQMASSEKFVRRGIVTQQNGTVENGWTTTEEIVTDERSKISDIAYVVQGTTGLGSSRMANEIDKRHEEMKLIDQPATSSSPIPLVRDDGEPLLVNMVKKPWNDMTSVEDNNYNSDEKNGPSVQQESHRDLVLEITHDTSVGPGSPDHSGSVNHISRTTADTEETSRKIEKWHEEIKPIITLVINSSSSSSSVENEIRQTQSEKDPRTTSTSGLETYIKCDGSTKNQKDDDQTDAKEQSKVIPTTSSSSGEYVTADETEIHSRGFKDSRTQDPCIIIKTEPCDEPPLSSRAESSSHRVFADGLTTSGHYLDGDILDRDMEMAFNREEKMIHVPARVFCERTRKKRRQESSPDYQIENTPKTSFYVAHSPSDTSATSIDTSSTSSSPRITTNRKSRGKKRRRKKEKSRNRSDRKTTRDGYFPTESRTSVVAKEKTHLHQCIGKNDSEGDAPTKLSKKRSPPRQNLRTNNNKSLQDQEDKPQDSWGTDDTGEDGSGDDSSGEFVIADQSPTSLKIVMRRSSRLRIRRASKLPRLRSRRNAFQTNASIMRLVHGKVKKKERRKSKVK